MRIVELKNLNEVATLVVRLMTGVVSEWDDLCQSRVSASKDIRGRDQVLALVAYRKVH
jgi:hypothetical protein